LNFVKARGEVWRGRCTKRERMCGCAWVVFGDRLAANSWELRGMTCWRAKTTSAHDDQRVNKETKNGEQKRHRLFLNN